MVSFPLLLVSVESTHPFIRNRCQLIQINKLERKRTSASQNPPLSCDSGITAHCIKPFLLDALGPLKSRQWHMGKALLAGLGLLCDKWHNMSKNICYPSCRLPWNTWMVCGGERCWGGGWEVGELGGSKTQRRWEKRKGGPTLESTKVMQEDEQASKSVQQAATLLILFISCPLILFLKKFSRGLRF